MQPVLRGDLWSTELVRRNNMGATWDIGWSFIFFSVRATTGSILTKVYFQFIKFKFVITVRLVAVGTSLETWRHQTTFILGFFRHFPLFNLLQLHAVLDGKDDRKLNEEDLTPSHSGWFWQEAWGVVTERKRAGPLKREGLSSLIWSGVCLSGDGRGGQADTLDTGHKPLMRKETQPSQDGPFRNRKHKWTSTPSASPGS